MFIVMTDSFPGYWGKGETEAEALAECKRHGGSRGPWLVAEIDPWWDEAWVDGMGQVMAQCSEDKVEVPRRERPPVVCSLVRLGVRGKRTAVAS